MARRRKLRSGAGPLVAAAMALRDKSPATFVFVAPLFPSTGAPEGCRCRSCRVAQEFLQSVANQIESVSPGTIARVARWTDGLADKDGEGKIRGFRLLAGATLGYYATNPRPAKPGQASFDVVSEPVGLTVEYGPRRIWKDYSLRGNGSIRRYADRGALPTKPLTWLQAQDILYVAGRLVNGGIRVGEAIALVSKSLMLTTIDGVWVGSPRALINHAMSCLLTSRPARVKGHQSAHGKARLGLMHAAATHVPYKDAPKAPPAPPPEVEAYLLSDVFRTFEFIRCPGSATWQRESRAGGLSIKCDHVGCITCNLFARMRLDARTAAIRERAAEAAKKFSPGQAYARTPQGEHYRAYGFMGDASFMPGMRTPGTDTWLSAQELGLPHSDPATGRRAPTEHVRFRGPIQFSDSIVHATGVSYSSACDAIACYDDSEPPSAPYRSKVWRTPIRGECARLVGLEVEFNDSPPPAVRQWAKAWSGDVHSDGSCGYEAVTPPVSGKYIHPCLKGLQRALVDCSADNRCGVHVHVEAADLGWYDVRRLLSVWRKIEPVMFVIAGQNRLGNRYCAQFGHAIPELLNVQDKVTWKSAIYNLYSASITNVRTRPLHKKDGGRYRCVNLMPWLAQRRTNGLDTTIEFRLHRATLSAERLTHWAQLVRNVVEWCSTHTDTDVMSLPKSSARALMVVAGDETPWVMARIRAWRNATTFVSERKHRETDEAGNIPPARAKRRIGTKGGAWRVINGTFREDY